MQNITARFCLLEPAQMNLIFGVPLVTISKNRYIVTLEIICLGCVLIRGVLSSQHCHAVDEFPFPGISLNVVWSVILYYCMVWKGEGGGGRAGSFC